MGGNKSWFIGVDWAHGQDTLVYYDEVSEVSQDIWNKLISMNKNKEKQMIDYFILAISSDGRPYMCRTSAMNSYAAEQNFRAKYPKSQFLKANPINGLTYIEQAVKHCDSCGQVVKNG